MRLVTKKIMITGPMPKTEEREEQGPQVDMAKVG